MLGRLIGLVVGLAIAAFGYGIYRPAVFARYVDLSHVPLGPFGQYKTVVVGVIMALGVAVALAALQRPSRSKRAGPAVTLFSEPEPDAHPAADHFAIKPESHDDHGHGHDDHGHGDHGHEDHGHGDHGHEAHGHDDHGHGHDDPGHGHDSHGHDSHAPAHH